MLKRSMFAGLALCVGSLVLSTPTRAADEMVDNPSYKSWSSHKAGTTVTAELNTDMAGQSFKSELSQTLIELTPEKAVVEMTTKLNIPGVPAQKPVKQEFQAKVKKSEVGPPKPPTGFKGDVKEIGNEKIEIDGKTFDCKVSEFNGEQKTGKTHGKTWMSESMPGMLVKTETAATASGREMKTSVKVVKVDLK